MARELITKGCEQCSAAEDVWLEASRLQPPELAKAVLARGVAHIPDSVKLVRRDLLAAIHFAGPDLRVADW